MNPITPRARTESGWAGHRAPISPFDQRVTAMLSLYAQLKRIHRTAQEGDRARMAGFFNDLLGDLLEHLDEIAERQPGATPAVSGVSVEARASVER